MFYYFLYTSIDNQSGCIDCKAGYFYILFMYPRMKILVFFAEISCFGGQRNEKGGQNVDGRNIRKFRQISEKFPFLSIYFGNFSPIFWKNWRLAPAIDPTAPNFPALIWISTFFPINQYIF